MRSLVNLLTLVFALVVAVFTTSCENSDRAKTVLWDSGPVQEIAHNGKYVGKVSVYTIDWIEYTMTRSEKEYCIYQKSNGEYIIDYNGENYIVKKAEEPFGEGVYVLKWKIDYNHYIEEIP